MYLKAILTLFASFLINLVSAQQQTPLVRDSAHIVQLIMKQQKAWNNGDIYGFMEPYWHSDSLVFIGKKGITRGWQATYENYKRAYPDRASMGTLDFELVSIQVLSAEYAYVIGKWKLTREETKGNLEGSFTLVLRKHNGIWLIISDHSS